MLDNGEYADAAWHSGRRGERGNLGLGSGTKRAGEIEPAGIFAVNDPWRFLSEGAPREV